MALADKSLFLGAFDGTPFVWAVDKAEIFFAFQTKLKSGIRISVTVSEFITITPVQRF
jgi:hypothetical protein